MNKSHEYQRIQETLEALQEALPDIVRAARTMPLPETRSLIEGARHRIGRAIGDCMVLLESERQRMKEDQKR